jgi:hypothetical protein
VGRDLGLGDCVAPVFEGQKLVLEKGMGEASNVTGDKNVIGDDAVHVESAAACIARNTARTGREFRLGQPFGVADCAEGDNGDIGLDSATVGELGSGESTVATVQRGDSDAAAQIHAVSELEFGGESAEGAAEGAN